MFDLHNNVHPVPVLAPSAGVADNTAQVGAIVDRAGYEALEYIIQTGTLGTAAATFTVLLEEGDKADMSDAAAVSDTDLIGTEALASFNGNDDGKCFKLGYKGGKRYTRITITPASNASAAPFSVVAVLGRPGSAPTANPPA